jgi:hypothetical protein
MDTSHVLVLPQRLKAVAEMAALLQRLDAQPLSVSPAQYRQVVQQLAHQLEPLAMDEALDRLLQAFPPPRPSTRTCITTRPACAARRWRPP